MIHDFLLNVCDNRNEMDSTLPLLLISTLNKLNILFFGTVQMMLIFYNWSQILYYEISPNPTVSGENIYILDVY